LTFLGGLPNNLGIVGISNPYANNFFGGVREHRSVSGVETTEVQ
jgi:hypothetical protein